ncbi:hypothetical protein ACFFX1_41550 [Dactylosporangium sucinum]|uniref:Uncharacterized protein n=1 Tax=Dactylosporangium sucinum TaxID=1424081 RepID=A0A917U565_9ACTN|nr:hypothetical protein [Dactylosporangium sucinum]GGM59394.1 hypothetical protein GCM10007977_071120 [Dactylosporangium sucinum]
MPWMLWALLAAVVLRAAAGLLVVWDDRHRPASPAARPVEPDGGAAHPLWRPFEDQEAA